MKRLISLSPILVALIIVTIAYCTNRPERIKRDHSNSRIKIVAVRRVCRQRVAIIRDTETGSEFLITLRGVVKIR